MPMQLETFHELPDVSASHSVTLFYGNLGMSIQQVSELTLIHTFGVLFLTRASDDVISS